MKKSIIRLQRNKGSIWYLIAATVGFAIGVRWAHWYGGLVYVFGLYMVYLAALLYNGLEIVKRG